MSELPSNAHVGYDKIDEYIVSTMGVTFGHTYISPPLFETVVLNSDGRYLYCARTDSLEDAKECHEEGCRMVREGKVEDEQDESN